MFHYLNYRIVWIKSDLLYKLLAADILREQNRAVDPDSGEKILRKKSIEKCKEIRNNCHFITVCTANLDQLLFLYFWAILFVFFITIKLFIRYVSLFKLDPDPHWGKQLDPDPQKMISIAAENITSSFLWRYESRVWVVSRENFLYVLNCSYLNLHLSTSTKTFKTLSRSAWSFIVYTVQFKGMLWRNQKVRKKRRQHQQQHVWRKVKKRKNRQHKSRKFLINKTPG